MIQKTVYICEQCGDNFSDSRLCKEHEAYHYGLTLLEYNHWMWLLRNVKQASGIVSVSKNTESDRALDKAINDLITFEREHNLQGSTAPNYF